MFRDKARYGQDPSRVVRSKPGTFRLPLARFPAEALDDDGHARVGSWGPAECQRRIAGHELEVVYDVGERLAGRLLDGEVLDESPHVPRR